MKTTINDYLKMTLDVLIILLTLIKSKIKDFSMQLKFLIRRKIKNVFY